ncbi:unnamed protein product [Paramecium primaurelia]|uniref:Uncharacterized protein n=2 Tax=Paramecium TaxID=5884 RepID=A0A8S1W3Q1_9CILI|nr:unnamed protein product [Paramecium primaurelia]CAD8183287.1 unnamed protein product [Paramecium pentaurelia]
MKILDEIKKQVEMEMQKIKKVQPTRIHQPLNSQLKKDLIILINKGVQLKDAARELKITYHEAKIAYNEYRRKALSSQSETESTILDIRTAGVSLLRVPPHHFIVQSVVENTITSVRKLYNVIVQNPILNSNI